MKTFSELARSVPRPLWIIPLILAIENTVVVQIPHPWFVIYLYRGIPIVFGLALLFLGGPRLRELGPGDFAVSRPFAAMHVAAVALFASLEFFLVRHYSTGGELLIQAAVRLWLFLVPVLVISLLAAFIPFRTLWTIARRLGPAWAYATICSALVVVLREMLRVSWDAPASRLGHALQTASFSQARAILTLFYPVVIAEPSTHILGTDRFLVEITATCSGIEGLALISAFMLVWFIFARRELRIARALLLVPVALSLMWVLNLGRLVTLIAIGHAGFERVAVNGFHTEAGWIAFVLVSLGFLLVAQHTPWFRQDGGTQAIHETGGVRSPSRNLAAIYLSPFLAITAAALISQAVSGGFEWLYPLRFLVALAVLWNYRSYYREMDWSFGLPGIFAGIAVAGIWLVAHFAVLGWHTGNPAASTLVTSLAQLSWAQRDAWIFVRVLAAVTTVPIAEELAFRGYLARRVMSEEVESIPFSQLGLRSIAISSLAFGLMHGRMWAVGILAGAVFAWVARLRNRLGEAIAAHAIANLTLAIVALARNDYTLW